jgi:cobalt-zinc-cadmium efflux system outer membrane protein
MPNAHSSSPRHVSQRGFPPRLATQLGLALGLALTTMTPGARADFPTLDRVAAVAQGNAVMVRGAAGNVRSAEGTLVGARASAIGNPYLDMQVDRGSSTKDVQALGFLYVPLDILGQRAGRIEEAEALVQWRKSGLLDAKALALGEATFAYGSVVVSAERLATARRGELSARTEADYFGERLRAQDATIYDKSLADTEVARWVQLRTEASLANSQATLRLSHLLTTKDQPNFEGLDAGPADGTPSTPPALRGAWDDAQLKRIVDRVPALRQLQAEERFWDASRKRYEAERALGIQLLLIGGRGDPGDLRLGGGVALTFPMTRRNQGEIARADAERARAQDVYQSYRHIFEERLRMLSKEYGKLRETLEFMEKTGIVSAEKTVEAAQEGYKRGKIDLSLTFVAKRELATMRNRKLDLSETAWRTYAELATLCGDLP